METVRSQTSKADEFISQYFKVKKEGTVTSVEARLDDFAEIKNADFSRRSGKDF